MKKTLACALALGLAAGPASADPVEGEELIVNGEIEMIVETAAPDHLEYIDTIYSGWLFRTAETRDLQRDDFDNPGLIGVESALDAWNAVMGSKGLSCAECHGEPEDSMSLVKATYPKFVEEQGRVMTTEQQVNNCLTTRMGVEKPWKYDGGDMTDMSALISFVGRGTPVRVAIDGPAAETWRKGKELYYLRTGQLELACSNCHEDNYGRMIRADHLSQGHINGFPTYRLKNTKLNAVHSRFKGCVRDTRAETFSPGSDEFVALELYLASRGNGLSVEGPSVRN